MGLFIDLMTIPIRLISWLPTIIQNSLKSPEDHKVITYLKEKGLTDTQIKEGNSIKLITRNSPTRSNPNIESLTSTTYDVSLENLQKDPQTPINRGGWGITFHSLDGNPLPVDQMLGRLFGAMESTSHQRK